jgi:hypothetical protein
MDLVCCWAGGALPGMRLLRLHLMRLHRSLWAQIQVQGGNVQLGLPPLAGSALTSTPPAA